MGRDLTVDELEAALCIGDLFAEAGGKLGEKIAVFTSCSLGVEMQLGDLASEQHAPLGIEVRNVALGVLDRSEEHTSELQSQ